MERWFRQRVDFKVVLPNVKDPKVTLVGGRMSRFANAEAAAIEYHLDQRRVSLFIVGEEAYNRLALGESPRFKLIRQRGYDVIIWRHGATGYTMVSEIGVRACRECHAPDETLDGASHKCFVARPIAEALLRPSRHVPSIGYRARAVSTTMLPAVCRASQTVSAACAGEATRASTSHGMTR